MPQACFKSVYMRGGTSRALVFNAKDLPAEPSSRDAIFLAALGSPDSNRRQLDGMGGAISSLSKIAIVGPASRADADVDYTFGQVAIHAPLVQYGGNCGNISSAIGPYAVDEGLVTCSGERASVRIHNTNTGKIIVAEFALVDGRAAVDGDFVLQGVAGTGSPVRLAFQDPGGAATGALFPTGSARDLIEIDGLGGVEVSMVDAANPVVFARASDLGLTGTELPDELDRRADMLALCEALRVRAAFRMGLVETERDARERMRNLPLVCLLSSAVDTVLANGEVLPAGVVHITARMFSAGQPHRATPLTGALCLAASMRLPGTLAAELARLPADPSADLMIGHPSGALPVAAKVSAGTRPWVEEAVAYRTARRLMEGSVLVPHSRLRSA